MSEPDFLSPNSTYSLKLGHTWDHIPSELVHGVQYDFKPASVDAKQPGQMKLSGKSDVSVILPHRENNECLEFQGFRQVAQKDCFLVVDEATKTVTLERISNMIRVKKHRSVTKKAAKGGVGKKEEAAEASPSLSSSSQPDRKHTPSPTEPLQQSESGPSESSKRQRLSAPPPPPPPPPPPSQVVAAPIPATNLSEDSSGSDSDSSSGESGGESGSGGGGDGVGGDGGGSGGLNVSMSVSIGAGGVGGVSSGSVIMPLGQPDKEDQQGNALMEILSRDLDMTSDEDEDDDD